MVEFSPQFLSGTRGDEQDMKANVHDSKGSVASRTDGDGGVGDASASWVGRMYQ